MSWHQIGTKPSATTMLTRLWLQFHVDLITLYKYHDPEYVHWTIHIKWGRGVEHPLISLLLAATSPRQRSITSVRNTQSLASIHHYDMGVTTCTQKRMYAVMTYKRVFVIKCISSTGHQTYTSSENGGPLHTHKAISSILHYRAGGPVNKA